MHRGLYLTRLKPKRQGDKLLAADCAADANTDGEARGRGEGGFSADVRNIG